MDTDSETSLSQAINTGLLHKEETEVILGHAFEVLRALMKK